MAWETRILVTTNSQSTANNTSNVTFTFQARRTDYSVYVYNNYGQAYWQIAAGGNSSGNNYFNINWQYGQNVWFTISSWTTTITHNSDGSYSSYAEAYVYTGVSPSSLSARVDYTLTTIPRESKISSIEGDTIGEDIIVNISRQSSSFTHQVWWRINGTGSWTSLGTGYGTSCTFTLPMSVCNSVTQSTSCTLNIAIRAMSNGSYVGEEVWDSKTVNVPSSVVPSFSSIGVSEYVASVKSLGIYVQGKSRLNLSINGASGSYGSWITSYNITVDNQNIYAASGTTNVINGSGNLTITAKITDSRGRSATKTSTINVKPYSAPKLTSYSATRQSTPTNVSVVASGTIASLLNGSTEKNSLTYVIKYKQSSVSTYTSVTVKSGGLSFSGLSKTLTGIDSTKSYDIQLVLSDYFSSVTYQLKLSTTKVISDYNKNGIGIGKYWERGTLDVDGDVYISNRLYVEGAISIPTAIKEGSTLPVAFTLDNTTDRFQSSAELPSFLGTMQQSGTWFNMISSRHRNGSGDGNLYGMVLLSNLTSVSDLSWRQQTAGTWQTTKTLLDSANYGGYFGDYVVKRGNSGIWEYRQWASGIRECWGTWSGTINLGQNNYSGFYYTDAQQISFPSGLFTRDDVRVWVDMGPTQFIGLCRAFARTKDWVRFICAGHSNYSQSGVPVFLYCQQWT